MTDLAWQAWKLAGSLSWWNVVIVSVLACVCYQSRIEFGEPAELTLTVIRRGVFRRGGEVVVVVVELSGG